MHKAFTRRRIRVRVLAAAALAIAVGTAQAADFSGKTIEWIIPFKEGGGSDTWARFNAPFFSRYLPGHPTVIVKNVPGGGSTTGANQFAARARPDGLTLLGTSGSTQFPYLLGDPRVRYEYQDWRIVMATPTGGVVYVAPSLGVGSAAQASQLQGKRLVYASEGATSLDLVPLLAFRLLGLDVQHVFGFKGRGAGRLAFERGEATIDYQTSPAYLSNVVPLVKEGKAVPLFSWGILDEQGNVVRDPTFPDLPSFPEAYQLATGRPPSGEAYDAYLAFFISGFAAQKMAFLPHGTPDDIVDAFRAAVRHMKDDPDYNAKKSQVLGDYEQVTGEAADALFKKATTVPDTAKKDVVEMLTTDYHVTLYNE